MKKYYYSFFTLFLMLTSIVLSGQTKKEACKACEHLIDLLLPDVTIQSAVSISEGTPHCKVLGTISKEIQFELLLPKSWNERFVMGGGGGFVGSIQNSARFTLADGFATAGTNTGHEGDGLKADWALYDMERQLNFGHLAVHRTAVVSKAIILDYYCKAPAYSYFFGCSRGGGQALLEAQRYPDDFDGIISAAPIISWPATGAEIIQNTQALYPDPNQLEAPIISRNHLQILQQSILAECDAQDGVEDGILNDPRICKFNLDNLPRCENKEERNNCFTTDQIQALKAIYEGARNEKGEIYPGFPFGCENEKDGIFNWIVGPDPELIKNGIPSIHYGLGTEMFKYLIFQDPNWDIANYDLSNFDQDTRYAAAYLDATSTDYSKFSSQGGKLILYHGWNDPALSALTSIEHYEAVKDEDPDVESFMKLYLLPGVLHCGGGPGPSQADWIQYIQEWVEFDKAPEKIIVSKMENGKVIMSRPVYPYPSKAVYKGEGDPNLAENFQKQ